MKEEWKQINGFGGKYYISSFGRVRSMYRGKERILKLKRHSLRGNYVYTSLNHKPINKFPMVHRLVAEYFIPNPENKPQVNHKDFNKGNNRVDNLEWATRLENSKHATKAGRLRYSRGESGGNSMINANTVERIIIDRFKNHFKYDDLMEKYNVSQSTIWGIVRGKRWVHIWNRMGMKPGVYCGKDLS